MKSKEALKKLRKQIDHADANILKALAKRAKVVQKIAKAKAEMNLPIVHPARQAEIQKARPRQGAKLGLDRKFVGSIFKLVQADSVQCQKKIIQKIKAKRIRSGKGKS